MEKPCLGSGISPCKGMEGKTKNEKTLLKGHAMEKAMCWLLTHTHATVPQKMMDPNLAVQKLLIHFIINLATKPHVLDRHKASVMSGVVDHFE